MGVPHTHYAHLPLGGGRSQTRARRQVRLKINGVIAATVGLELAKKEAQTEDDDVYCSTFGS